LPTSAVLTYISFRWTEPVNEIWHFCAENFRKFITSFRQILAVFAMATKKHRIYSSFICENTDDSRLPIFVLILQKISLPKFPL
jgi:hypothetical protein